MWLLGAAILIGSIGRVVYSWSAPLWLDETYSAAIAGQRDWQGLIRWCLYELTGPGYYVPLWAWARAAGTSDLALRLPSLVLALATPLLAFRARAWNRDVRHAWAALIALWLPAYAVAGEARGYALLLLLGVAQIMLLRRLLVAPSITRAAAWLAVSGWMLLINYWSGIPALAQGLVYLAVHRRRAIATWPAIVVMVPVAAWMQWHLPKVIGATMGSIGGGPIHAGLGWGSLLDLPAMLLGTAPLGWGTIGLVGGSLIVARRAKPGTAPVTADADRAVIWAGLLGIALVVALAIARPGFNARYATAAIPGLLFVIACWLAWARRAVPQAATLMAALWLASAVGLVAATAVGPDTDPRHRFQLETPSTWIGQAAPDTALILWDGAIASRGDPQRVGEIGGYFLRRAGAPVRIEVAMPDRLNDPNRQITAWLARHRNGAVLWFANEEIDAARQPRLLAWTAGHACRDFGGDGVIVFACRPGVR